MNICIIHKGIKDTSTLRNYFHQFGEFSINEVALSVSTLEELASYCPDIVIFDCITWLGELSDVDYIQEVRRIVAGTPILLVTSSGELASYRELMLDGGVDGCIQVPFLAEELRLRILKLISKKNTLLFSGTQITTDTVTVDVRDHVVTQHGEQIHLTRTEYSILLHLFLHKNVLVETKDLSLCLRDANEDSLALGIHMFNLRKKINSPNLIKTVPLYGFTVSDKVSSL